MPLKKKGPQTVPGEEQTTDWTPPTDEELAGGASPPPAADPNPADPILEAKQKILSELGFRDVDAVKNALGKVKELQGEIQQLKHQAKEQDEIHDQTDETKRQLESMKARVAYAEQIKALKSLNPDTSAMDMSILMTTMDRLGQPRDDGTKAEIAAIRQQQATTEKERAQADMKHAQEIAEMKRVQDKIEDKRAQELAEMKHAQERAEDKRAQELAEMKRIHEQEIAEMKRTKEQEIAEQRHAQERAEDKRAQELAEQRHAQDLTAIMQQTAALQLKIDAAGSRPPGALGAIGEIKALITDANNLKVALKDLGLTGGEGGKDSLAGAVVDKLLGSVMKLANTAGLGELIQGATGQGQQAAGPPPAPEDRPPTQDEFDQASVEWFRLHGSTVKPGQIKMTDDGFLIGNGPEIQTYINSNPRTTGVQPCISKEGLYMVPPTMSKAYLDWVRNVTAQAQGGAGAPPTKKGDSNVRTGF